MQALIARASLQYGGNALGLNPDDGDRIWFDLGTSWLTPVGDAAAASTAVKLSADIISYAQTTYQDVPNTRFAGDDLAYASYNPIYSNDAMPDQHTYQTYAGGNFERLKSIQESVDPEGFFATRTGGFKYF